MKYISRLWIGKKTKIPVFDSLYLLPLVMNKLVAFVFDPRLLILSTGGVAATVTTPMDVIKTRVMLAEGSMDTKRRSIWGLHSHVVREILHDRGLPGYAFF